MGFNSVFRGLQEAFPQVDSRILKAVAIEHPKDVDAAAEVVLVEVIPFLPREVVRTGSSGDLVVEAAYNPGTGKVVVEAVPASDSTHPNETTSPRNDSSFSNANGNRDQVYSNEEVISSANEEASYLEPGLEVASSATSMTAAQENNADNMYSHVQESFATEESGSLLNISVDCSARQGSSVFSTNGDTDGFSISERRNFTVPSASECLVVVSGECHEGQLCVDGKQAEEEVQLALSPVRGSSTDDPEGSIELAVKQTMDTEELEPSSVVAIVSNIEVSPSTMADDLGNESLNSMVTRSAQVCSVDLLEDIIEDARNNKKTLFSAMESVISMMREVELQEKAAEQAKEEALRGGHEMYSKAEDMKQMLRHAKEGNDMNAGEVYGEKAILATEMRELQSRLLSLSDEKNNALAILDEMRHTLVERLDATEKERKLAEQERMEKEALASEAYAEQQRIMEKVVEESKMLKQQAEENSKLQEFLMDRGRVVDTLQGEISVICQDVKLLKQKFDERVPLSKSLSSSQTTCLLASSSSSLRSVASDQFPEQAEPLFTSEKLSRESSLEKLSRESSFSDQLIPRVVVREGNDRDALLDDGWEFFERSETQEA